MSDHLVAHKLLSALKFASDKHRNQRRKDAESSPYVNHPIAVAEVLSGAGVTDIVTLQGAILHDTIEDTETTPDELAELFGPDVSDLVLEVTDDKSLPKEARKRLQVEHAPHLSSRARLVKIADKICNIRDVTHFPPVEWSLQRKQEYLDWTEDVVHGCRGINENLDKIYDHYLNEGRRTLLNKNC